MYQIYTFERAAADQRTQLLLQAREAQLLRQACAQRWAAATRQAAWWRTQFRTIASAWRSNEQPVAR